MLNILKGGSRRGTAGLSFSAEDIKSIVETFKIDDETSKNGLVTLKSGDGVTSRKFIVKKIETWTAEEDHLKLGHLAQRLDVSVNVVNECRKDVGRSLLGADGQRLRSQKIVAKVANDLHDRAVAGYVNLADFASQNDIHIDEVKTLLGLAAAYSQVDADRTDLALPRLSQIAGRDYVAIRTVDDLLKDRLEKMLTEAVQRRESVDIMASQFPELDSPTLQCYATDSLTRLERMHGQEYQGRFIIRDEVNSSPQSASDSPAKTAVSDSEPQSVIFVPRGADQRRLMLAASNLFEVGNSIHLREWVAKHNLVPDLLPTPQDALRFVQDGLHDIDGDKIDVLVCQPSKSSSRDCIIISGRALDEHANDAWKQHQRCDIVDVASYLSHYPEAPEDVGIYLVRRLMDLARADPSTSSRSDCISSGTLVYTSQFHQQMLARAQVLIEQAAKSKWEGVTDKPASQLKLEQADVRNSGDIYCPLITYIAQRQEEQWTGWRHQFDGHIDRAAETAFALVWRDRLTARLQLYTTGLTALSDSPLKDQLSELLRDHLVKELLPPTIQRTTEKARGFATDRTPKRLAKLRTKLTDTTSLDTCVTQVGKFEEKSVPIIEPLSTDELRERQSTEILGLYKITKSDKDAARRFLCAVLILLASRCKGILYATGKFAPKLLKAVGDDLDPEQYKSMERFKDEAKKGTISRDTLAQVDDILAAVLKELGIATG